MKKSHYLILNILTVISINIAFFLCNCYPKHILEDFSSISIVECIFNSVFFIIHAIFLIITFSRNKTFFSRGAFKLYIKTKKDNIIVQLIVLVILQFIFDVILLQLSNTSIEFRYISIDLLMILYWILIYIILSDKNIAIWKNKKRLLWASLILVLSLGLSMVFNIYQISNYNTMSEKYLESSPYFLQICKNLDFANEIKLLIMDCIITCSFVVIHITGQKCEKKDIQILDDDAWMSEKMDSFRRKLRLFIYCDLTVGIIILIVVLKLAFLPQSTLIVSYGTKTESSKGINDFYSVETVEKYRGFKTNRESVPIYFNKKVTICKPTIEPVEFNFNGLQPECVLGDVSAHTASCFEYDIDGNKVYLYGNYAILFYENEEAKIIRIEELSTHKNNDYLTLLCKRLISDGNLFAFEYGCEYLLKNDKNFIQPYINRYSKGEFTVEERKWLEKSFYKEEYIVDLAETFSN